MPQDQSPNSILLKPAPNADASTSKASTADFPEQEKKVLSKKQKWIIIILAAVCTNNLVIGISSVMPLLPYLSEIFNVSYSQVSLLIVAFTMPGIFFTPLAGIWADKYGRKVVLIPSLILFSVAGFACAFAPSFHILVFLRFLQGMGAASLGILNTTILADSFSGPRLAKLIGYNMALLSICTALYPTIGGFLGELNWRYTFCLPLLSIPSLFIAFIAPLQGAGQKSSFSSYVGKMLSSAKTPIVKLLLIITFLTFLMLYGPIITCFPALTHIKFNASPATTGLLMMFLSLGTGLVSSQLGTLSMRFPRKNLLITSQLCYIIALVGLPFVPQITFLFPFLIFYGMGQGLNIPNIQTALIQMTNPAQRASILALNASLLRTGQTLSPFIFTSLLDFQGINAPFWAAIIIPLVVICLVLRLPSNLK